MTEAPNWRMRLYVLPLILALVGLVLVPLASILRDSFYVNDTLSLGNYAEVIGSHYYQEAFLTSFWISLLTTAVGLVVGLPVAILLRRRSATVRSLAMSFSNIGANFAGVPLAMAMVILLGLNGVLTLILKSLGLSGTLNVYSEAGLALAYTYFQIALGTLLLIPVVTAVGSDVEEAAALMGVSSWRFWRRIGLPVVARQIGAVAILLFANAMGTYATTIALTGTSVNVVTIGISELAAGDVFSDPNLANALAMCLLVCLVAAVALGQILQREPKA